MRCFTCYLPSVHPWPINNVIGKNKFLNCGIPAKQEYHLLLLVTSLLTKFCNRHWLQRSVSSDPFESLNWLTLHGYTQSWAPQGYFLVCSLQVRNRFSIFLIRNLKSAIARLKALSTLPQVHNFIILEVHNRKAQPSKAAFTESPYLRICVKKYAYAY